MPRSALLRAAAAGGRWALGPPPAPPARGGSRRRRAAGVAARKVAWYFLYVTVENLTDNLRCLFDLGAIDIEMGDQAHAVLIHCQG